MIYMFGGIVSIILLVVFTTILDNSIGKKIVITVPRTPSDILMCIIAFITSWIGVFVLTILSIVATCVALWVFYGLEWDKPIFKREKGDSEEG
jgi:hypothetical protein